MSVWTRDEVVSHIKLDLLLEHPDLAHAGVTLQDIEDGTPLLGSGPSIDSVNASLSVS